MYIFESGFPISQTQKIDEPLAYDTVCVKYLYKIMEECEKRGIEIIFTFMPMAESYAQDWLAVNTGERIAGEHDILFLNLLDHNGESVAGRRDTKIAWRAGTLFRVKYDL